MFFDVLPALSLEPVDLVLLHKVQCGSQALMKSEGYSHSATIGYLREVVKYFCQRYVLQWYKRTFAQYPRKCHFYAL
jgi:hypothetical protein